MAVDRLVAQELLLLANAATEQLLRSIDEVSKAAPEHAALRYRRKVLEVIDPLSDIVFAIWRAHPELEPPREPGVTYYDPTKWFMPKAVVRRAAQAIAEAERPVTRMRAIAELVKDADLSAQAARAVELLSSAAFGVRQQHSAFRGARPTEDPLAPPRASPRQRQHKARRRTKR